MISHDSVMTLGPKVMLEENRIEKKRKEENINTCSELPKKNGSIEADKPVYCTIITNTGWEYPITTDLVELWKTTFPAVNIEQQLLSMKSWSVTHPKNRKTKGGMLAFVNNWLSKEQNKAGDTRSKQVKRFATETGSLQTSPNDYNSL